MKLAGPALAFLVIVFALFLRLGSLWALNVLERLRGRWPMARSRAGRFLCWLGAHAWARERRHVGDGPPAGYWCELDCCRGCGELDWSRSRRIREGEDELS